MPTLEQIRAARALLGWSQSDLADRAGLSQTGIARIENGTNHPNSQTLAKIEGTFDSEGIEFILDSGVQKRANSFRVLKGAIGFEEFAKDVYTSLGTYGGDLCIFNADPQNWSKFLSEEAWQDYRANMIKIKDKINAKIIIQENNNYLLAHEYAQYRWSASEGYDPTKTLHTYADKIAFLDFSNDDVSITIMQRAEFAAGFKLLFQSAWEAAEEISE